VTGGSWGSQMKTQSKGKAAASLEKKGALKQRGSSAEPRDGGRRKEARCKREYWCRERKNKGGDPENIKKKS